MQMPGEALMPFSIFSWATESIMVDYSPNPLFTRSAMVFKTGRSARSSIIIVICVPLVHASVKMSIILDASAFSSSFCIQTFAIEFWAMSAIWAADRACRPNSFTIVTFLHFSWFFLVIQVQGRKGSSFRVQGRPLAVWGALRFRFEVEHSACQPPASNHRRRMTL